MKSVAPVRKDMGVKTFFNMLGPLVNPSFPQNQLVGVYDLELSRLYNYMLQTSDKNYTIIHSLDGYDEVSLTGDFKVVSNYGEMVMSPDDLGMKAIKPEEISGGNSIPEAVKIFTDILEGKGTKAQNSVVIANAALGLQCIDHDRPFEEHLERAKESLFSGKAKNALKKLLEIK
jgi:anthranilate phosphoribosyltransferase